MSAPGPLVAAAVAVAVALAVAFGDAFGDVVGAEGPAVRVACEPPDGASGVAPPEHAVSALAATNNNANARRALPVDIVTAPCRTGATNPHREHRLAPAPTRQ